MTANRGSALQFVVLMGFVAMLADLGYEGMRGVSGEYLRLLGASAATVGFVAGLGEMLGFGLRWLAGWLGDRLRAWWPLLFVGYGVNLIAIPGLAFAGSWEVAVLLLFLERLGKGIRSPAKSTLMSHAAKSMGAGMAFGLAEALDQLGAVSGPLLVVLAVWAGHGTALERYQGAFLILGVPVLLNMTLLLVARARFPDPAALEPPPSANAPGPLPGAFHLYVVASALFAAGLADWALFAFHFGRTGRFPGELLPAVYAGAMAVDGVAALLFGLLFDRIGLRALALGLVLSSPAAALVLLGGDAWVVGLGVAAWAVGMGAQESIAKAAIAELVPKERRGRAYGEFFAVFGLAWWAGSAGLGGLYDRSLPAAAAVSGGAQLLAVPLLLILAGRLRAHAAQSSTRS